MMDEPMHSHMMKYTIESASDRKKKYSHCVKSLPINFPGFLYTMGSAAISHNMENL